MLKRAEMQILWEFAVPDSSASQTTQLLSGVISLREA